MTYQLMTIGPSPCEETCAQVGQADYEERSRRECRVYLRMLERLYPLAGDVPARFTVRSSPHDFGAYREVCVRYDDTDARACDHAYEVERHSPAEWDAIARYELLWIERHDLLQRAVHRGEMLPQEVPERYRGSELPALPAHLGFAELLAAFPL